MQHIAKRIIKTIAPLLAGACLLCLSGCSMNSPSVEELLRAPLLAGDYSDIQSALAATFDDSTVQLKYPTEGELLSPYAFGDWSGGGENEAAVLFTTEESTNVQIGILQQDEAGAWQVVGVADGLSDTVSSIAFANLQEGDAQQIVVTFAAQGSEYLAVYVYQDGALSVIFQQPYTQYLIEHITDTTREDLILITEGENGALQMTLFTFGADGVSETLVPSFNEEPFTDYLNICVTTGSYGRQYLMIDGFVGEGQTTVVTEMIWYNASAGTFEDTWLPGTDDLFNDSKRYSDNLISQDINDDGVIEVPVQYSGDGVLNYVQNSPITIIAWENFTGYSTQKSFGLFDDEYNYYLELPDEIVGNLMLVDGEDGSIEVRNLAGDVLYFSLRVANFDEVDSGWYQIGSVASKQIQVKIGDESTSFLTVYSLSKSVYLL